MGMTKNQLLEQEYPFDDPNVEKFLHEVSEEQFRFDEEKGIICGHI